MATSDISPDTRKRLALNFVLAYVIYVVVILIAGEAINAPTLVLGVVLAAFVVWLGERRRRRTSEDAGRPRA